MKEASANLGSRRRRKALKLGAGTAGLLAAALVAIVGAGRFRQAKAGGDHPLAPARKGEFLVIVQCRGELVARRSVQIAAPLNVPNLQIVWLAASGGPVETGQTVIRFDASSARQQFQEKEAALKQAQASLDQAVAQARVTAEQDKRELANARLAVERAKLEASKQEIVSVLQGEESRIDLGLANDKLNVQEATADLNQASSAAKVAALTSARDKAQAEVDLAKERLEQMEIKAPSKGIIVYMNNYSQGWVNARPFKVGDNVWPGSALAEIPELDSLEMKGKLEEIDRGRLRLGNPVRVHVDALSEKPLPGELAAVRPLTEQSFEWPPTRSFRAFARITEPDARLRPGMNGRMDVIVDRIPDAISVPAKAVFTRHGKPVVFVSGKDGFRMAAIEVVARNPDEVAVRGLSAGTMVSLRELGEEELKP